MKSILYTPVEAYLKTIKLLCLITILFGSITSGSIWAWGGHGGGHYYGGWGYRGFLLGLNYGLGYGRFGGYGSYGLDYRGYGLGYGGSYSPYYGIYGLGYGGGLPLVIYIQQENSEKAATESQTNDWHDWNEWHWCGNPEGYYPYVKNCLNDWIPVAPQPTATNE